MLSWRSPSAMAPQRQRVANWASISRGALPKALEDKTFPLKAGEITDPILTRQGYIILKVIEHVPGGPRPFKEVESQVEDAFYMSRMEPAIRAYLTKMREDAFIDIKPGYTDTGASPNETKPVYSAYMPPAPKKKAKVERTRFRETTHTFRQKSPQAAGSTSTACHPLQHPPWKRSVRRRRSTPRVQSQRVRSRARRKRFALARVHARLSPRSPTTAIENAGALPETASNANEPVNPLEAAAPEKKTRFSARAKVPKQPKAKSILTDRRAGSCTGRCRRGCRSSNAVWPIGPGR